MTRVTILPMPRCPRAPCSRSFLLKLKSLLMSTPATLLMTRPPSPKSTKSRRQGSQSTKRKRLRHYSLHASRCRMPQGGHPSRNLPSPLLPRLRPPPNIHAKHRPSKQSQSDTSASGPASQPASTTKPSPHLSPHHGPNPSPETRGPPLPPLERPKRSPRLSSSLLLFIAVHPPSRLASLPAPCVSNSHQSKSCSENNPSAGPASSQPITSKASPTTGRSDRNQDRRAAASRLF